MGGPIYSAVILLDGYHTDSGDNFDWAEPDEEVHAFINDLERDVGTSLYGRRMYEMMTCWENDPALAAQSDLLADVIYFTTDLLHHPGLVSTTNTRLERELDLEEIRTLKSTVSADPNIGGPTDKERMQ